MTSPKSQTDSNSFNSYLICNAKNRKCLFHQILSMPHLVHFNEILYSALASSIKSSTYMPEKLEHEEHGRARKAKLSF